jgi:hypothetical protein
MTDLSPAAQAVYDAFNRIGLYNEPSFKTDRKALAAALQAAADQVVPDRANSVGDAHDDARRDQWMRIRRKLLAIAAELEGVQ